MSFFVVRQVTELEKQRLSLEAREQELQDKVHEVQAQLGKSKFVNRLLRIFVSLVVFPLSFHTVFFSVENGMEIQVRRIGVSLKFTL